MCTQQKKTNHPLIRLQVGINFTLKYPRDLNNKHLNSGNIWIANFHLSRIHLSGIQMVFWYSDHHLKTGLVFKWQSEYRTKFIPVFKWHSHNGPFSNRTTFDHSNTRLVQYSDLHCIVHGGLSVKLLTNNQKRFRGYLKTQLLYAWRLTHFVADWPIENQASSENQTFLSSFQMFFFKYKC